VADPTTYHVVRLGAAAFRVSARTVVRNGRLCFVGGHERLGVTGARFVPVRGANARVCYFVCPSEAANAALRRLVLGVSLEAVS
jgi:hypothetical protein